MRLRAAALGGRASTKCDWRWGACEPKDDDGGVRAEAAETGRGERMMSSLLAPSAGCTLCVCVCVRVRVCVWAGRRERG